MSDVMTAEAWGNRRSPDHYVRSLVSGDQCVLEESSDFARCLQPLLSSLGWRGEGQHLIEIMPHCADSIDLTDLRNILANADYQSRPIQTSVKDLDIRLMPCLFVAYDGRPLVVLGKEGPSLHVFEPAEGKYGPLTDGVSMPGTAYIFEKIQDRHKRLKRHDDNFVQSLFTRFKDQFWLLAIIGFVTTIPGLISPIFVMVLYDTVIAAQSTGLLIKLSMAAITILIIDLLFRLIRARVMAYIATRLGRLISLSAFGRLMELSPEALSQAPLQAQVRRVRQFEGWREYFADPIVSVAFNLPYSLIFLLAISLIGGSLVILPIIVMMVYACLAWFAGPVLERYGAEANEARQLRDACFDEMVGEMRAIRLLSIEAIWLERFRNYAAGSALAGVNRSRLQDILNHIGQGAVTIAGTGTLIVGANAAMTGDLSVGALIASMALVWRVLSPWQQCIGLLPRLSQLRSEAAMINQTMLLPAEAENRHRRVVPSQSQGAIQVEGVSLTYGGASRPALLGVDLSVNAGEIVGFIGESGAGKSSMLKIVSGIYMPQSGSVRIDGFDLRQRNPRELREQVAYAPQQPHFFTGTIAQNLRLAYPTATDQQLWNACLQAGVLNDVRRLKEGFETRIGDASVRQQPPGFLQRLSLARAYLKESDILILDEPERALDSSGASALLTMLSTLKGKQTVLLVTHQMNTLRIADRVFILRAGRIAPYNEPIAGGPPKPGAAIK